MAFKTVYTLELKRRENEKKIIALYVEMKDMMSVLLQYVSVPCAHYLTSTHSQGYKEYTTLSPLLRMEVRL